MQTWPVQDAKARFSEFLEACMADGPQMVTSWQPTPSEVAALTKGAPIYLTVLGTGHPPVILSVGEVPE